VPAGIANARARSVAAPIANRELQKSTGGGRKCSQLFFVEHEGGGGFKPMVLEQERCQRGRKVYSLHAPEVEGIGKGKAHRPYEFGVKVSVATTVKHSAGGQFVTHAAALPDNPYDGATVIPQMQALIGNILDRCITDAGYRGHNAP